MIGENIITFPIEWGVTVPALLIVVFFLANLCWQLIKNNVQLPPIIIDALKKQTDAFIEMKRSNNAMVKEIEIIRSRLDEALKQNQ